MTACLQVDNQHNGSVGGGATGGEVSADVAIRVWCPQHHQWNRQHHLQTNVPVRPLILTA